MLPGEETGKQVLGNGLSGAELNGRDGADSGQAAFKKAAVEAKTPRADEAVGEVSRRLCAVILGSLCLSTARGAHRS